MPTYNAVMPTNVEFEKEIMKELRELPRWKTEISGMEQTLWIKKGYYPPTTMATGGNFLIKLTGEFEELPGTTLEQHRRAELIGKNRTLAHQLRMKFARRRALKLLLAHLTDTQQQEWKKEQAFHVETADGRRRYRIKYGMAGNIKLVKLDGPVHGKLGQAIREGDVFCWHVCHPDGYVPEEDNVLAQKMMLETPEGERQFLAEANVS